MINSGPQNGNSIDKGAVGGVLATLHSPIVRFLPTGLGLDPIATLHQSFVLRRRTDLDDGGLDVYGSFSILLSITLLILPNSQSALMATYRCFTPYGPPGRAIIAIWSSSIVHCTGATLT